MKEKNNASYAEMDLKRSAEARNNQTQTRTTHLVTKGDDPDKIKEVSSVKAK